MHVHSFRHVMRKRGISMAEVKADKSAEDRALQWMEDKGYQCMGVPLHYATESHTGYQYPDEFAATYGEIEFERGHLSGLEEAARAIEKFKCDNRFRLHATLRGQLVQAIRALSHQVSDRY